MQLHEVHLLVCAALRRRQLQRVTLALSATALLDNGEALFRGNIPAVYSVASSAGFLLRVSSSLGLLLPPSAFSLYEFEDDPCIIGLIALGWEGKPNGPISAQAAARGEAAVICQKLLLVAADPVLNIIGSTAVKHIQESVLVHMICVHVVIWAAARSDTASADCLLVRNLLKAHYETYLVKAADGVLARSSANFAKRLLDFALALSNTLPLLAVCQDAAGGCRFSVEGLPGCMVIHSGRAPSRDDVRTT